LFSTTVGYEFAGFEKSDAGKIILSGFFWAEGFPVWKRLFEHRHQSRPRRIACNDYRRTSRLKPIGISFV